MALLEFTSTTAVQCKQQQRSANDGGIEKNKVLPAFTLPIFTLSYSSLQAERE